MAIAGLFHSMSLLVTSYTKRVSHAAAKKLRSSRTISKLGSAAHAAPFLSRRASFVPFLGIGAKKRVAEENEKDSKEEEEEEKRSDSEEEEEEDEGVWRKTILLGEKCQPLDFSGVIYYDNKGRPLPEIPKPRLPLRSPLPSYAFCPATEAIN